MRTLRLADIQNITAEALRRLTAIQPDLEQIHRRILDACGGYPATTLGGGTRGGGTNSPVETQAGQPDPARADLAKLEQTMRDLDRTIAALGGLSRTWQPQNHPCAAGCTTCGARPSWRSTAAGALTTPQCLCRKCREFTQAVGRVPTSDEIAAGHKIRVTPHPVTAN